MHRRTVPEDNDPGHHRKDEDPRHRTGSRRHQRPEAPEDDDPENQRTTEDDDPGTGGKMRTQSTEGLRGRENKGPRLQRRRPEAPKKSMDSRVWTPDISFTAF